MAEQERPPETNIPLRVLDPPAPDYRLPDADRARLQEWVSAERLERLLALTPPEYRPWLLEGFCRPAGPSHSATIRLPDARLQAALEDVYAGWWEALPPDWRAKALADSATAACYPGSAIAQARWAEDRDGAP